MLCNIFLHQLSEKLKIPLLLMFIFSCYLLEECLNLPPFPDLVAYNGPHHNIIRDLLPPLLSSPKYIRQICFCLLGCQSKCVHSWCLMQWFLLSPTPIPIFLNLTLVRWLLSLQSYVLQSINLFWKSWSPCGYHLHSHMLNSLNAAVTALAFIFKK